MKVKISPNPEFDFTIMEMGGFDDIPTKQDKFKPLSTKAALLEYSDGSTEIINNEIYIINESKRQNQQTFEANFKKFVGENVDSSHPYKKPLELEVVIGINMTEKRKKNVDIDNLVKCILDCMNGLVYEDDTQIICLLAKKSVIQDDFVPQLSGISVGVRIITEQRPVLLSAPIYVMEYIDDNSEK